jgi:hypothetical protein
MKPSCLIAPFAVLLSITSCSSPTAPDTTIPVVSVRTDTYTGFTDSARLVIRDQTALLQAWARLLPFADPPPPLPVIDFNQDMLVLVAMGSQPSSGYAISIESAMERGDAATIAVLSISPGQGCASLTVITNPVALIRMARHASVSFVERRQMRDCS